MSAELPPPSIGAVLTYLRITLPRAGLSPREQTVAWTIASHYNWREGCARPSQATVGEEMNLSPDVIWRCVRAITRAGIWTVTRGTSVKNASKYRFPLAGHLEVAKPPADLADGSAQLPADTAGGELSTLPAESPELPADLAGKLPADLAGLTETRTETCRTLAPRTVSDGLDGDAAPDGDSLIPPVDRARAIRLAATAAARKEIADAPEAPMPDETGEFYMALPATVYE